MEIIPLEEIESNVNPLLSGLTEYIDMEDFSIKVISQKFDYLRLISNPYSQFFCMEPIELQQSIAKASQIMNDSQIHLSFVGYDKVFEPNTPLNFKFSTE